MARIVFENVCVQYPLYAVRTSQLRHSLVNMATGGRIYEESNRVSYVEALHDISFTLEDGDRLALVGHNGAGKSTLLKTLGGFLPTASGKLTVDGDISVLLNLMNGLDPEKTGYENIRGMGLILGMNKKTIARITPEVEAFCELGEFLNLPVRMYSDGMRVRLAFAVSTSITPEILVLDEAIGAGDAHFLHKATERAHQLYDQARIMVMASHAPAILRDLCNKALLLEKGHIRMFGKVDEVLDLYGELSRNTNATEHAA
ncbi:MAG: ABC transporter ATP-binding protein [Pseudomonadota bacterium]